MVRGLDAPVLLVLILFSILSAIWSIDARLLVAADGVPDARRGNGEGVPITPPDSSKWKDINTLWPTSGKKGVLCGCVMCQKG